MNAVPGRTPDAASRSTADAPRGRRPAAATRRAACAACAAFAALALLALAGCGGERAGPEAEIRTLLETAERAAEARDANAVLALVSREYADSDGRDRTQLGRHVRGLIALHPQVELLVNVEAIEVESPEHARARLAVALLGRRGASVEGSRLAADLRPIELRLRRDDGEWRVVAADWRDRGP